MIRALQAAFQHEDHLRLSPRPLLPPPIEVLRGLARAAAAERFEAIGPRLTAAGRGCCRSECNGTRMGKRADDRHSATAIIDSSLCLSAVCQQQSRPFIFSLVVSLPRLVSDASRASNGRRSLFVRSLHLGCVGEPAERAMRQHHGAC